MKKGRIMTVINETVEKTYTSNMNEDSFYDGHKFVDYGKNIENVSLIMPSTDAGDYSINKDKLMISWGVKFQFRNSGVEGFEVSVLGLEANLMISGGESEPDETPINFGEYKIEVVKEKNLENNDLEIFISSIEIDAERRIVTVVVSI